jgi:predicted transcriptional regulator
VWDRVKDILKDKGHNEVFAIIATEEPIAVHKLSQSFGFYAILKISNAIVYRQEL